MKLDKLIFIVSLIAISFFDFSPGLNHNSWVTEPIGNSLVAYDNYVLISQAIADNAIVPEYTPYGFDLYIINGILLFFLVFGLILRSFWSRKISNPGVLTYSLVFLVSFLYAMSTEWSFSKFPPWVFLFAVVGLILSNSKAWLNYVADRSR